VRIASAGARLRRPRHRLTAFVALVTAVTATLGWGLVSPAPAAAAAVLVGSGSGRCLDVAGNVSTAGTALDIWDCNGQANQAFEFTPAGELRTFSGSRCVDADNNGTAPGTKAIIWTCTGGANQQWRYNSSTGTITGVQSGLCLDVSAAGTADGTAVALWTCNGQSNQHWNGGSSTNTLVVDMNTVVRPVTRVGSGTLYGLKDASTPPVSGMTPLHLNTVRQPPPGTQHRPNGSPVPIGDTLVVGANAKAAGAKILVDMADIYDGFPYDWVSWSDWLGKINTMMAAAKARTDLTNISAWEPWNEPDWTWPTSAAGSFNDGWVRSFQQIRSQNSSAQILGPSISYWNASWMTSFLTNAKATNTLPDIICWHELSGYGNVTNDVNAYRALEKQLGISPRPISIDEYATTGEIDVPSSVNHYIAQFERDGVHDAERAFWYEAGTLNGLLYNNQPTASYWMYKWYGDQSGNVVKVTPTAYNDGVAAYDSGTKTMSLVFGGQSGTNYIRVDGLGQLSTKVTATVNYVAGTGRTTNVAAPTTLSTSTYTVTNGSLTIPVPNEDPYGAYELVVKPQ